MRWLVSVVLVCAMVRATCAQGSSSWDCETFSPNLGSLQGRPPSDPTTSPYRLSVAPSAVTAGQDVTVSLIVEPSKTGEITGFMIQARRVGSTVPQGTWSIPSSNLHAMTRQCGEHEADTATNKQLHAVQTLELTWTAPEAIPEGYRVQLVGAALDGTAQQYWTLHGNSIVELEVTTATVVREEEGAEEGDAPAGGDDEITEADLDPQVTSLDAEDEHDLLLETQMEQEYLEKKQADIAMENLASETGTNLEDDKKKHEEEYKWEMEDYEKRMYEEELRRQSRIDAELRDKEEWEAQQFELEQKKEQEAARRKQERRERLGDTLQEVGLEEIDTEDKEKKTSAGCRQTSTFTLYSTFFLVMLACLL